jgi:hypothetical protein
MWVSRLLSLLLPFKSRELRCSFCNSPQSAVWQLIAGPSAYICNECVAICDGIVAQHAKSPVERPHVASEISICLVCKRGKAAADCAVVPARGVVCLQCADMIKAAADMNRASR